MAPSRLTRRHMLRAGAGLFLASHRSRAAGSYRVGVGVDAGGNGYAAALRAIGFSASWASLSLSGRIVVVKPNLVTAATPESGAVTDPEVVRAVVDLCLLGGARAVLIVENSRGGALFNAAGYSATFSAYPAYRVLMLDQLLLPHVMAPVPGGYNYGAIRVPEFLTSPDVILINVAKLKTHAEAGVTLAAKNGFGYPEANSYINTELPAGRFSMHDRGLHYSIADLNLLRSPDFHVVDGIWGMEGLGPTRGTPVRMNAVFAGTNALAVDRAAAAAMQVPDHSIRHFIILAGKGLGPSSLSEVEIAGDSLTPRAFLMPPLPPVLDRPYLSAVQFNPGRGERVVIIQGYYSIVHRKAEIVALRDDTSAMRLIRTLLPFAYRGPGADVISWDGRDDAGAIVPPAQPPERYAVHFRAYGLNPDNNRPADSINWITVTNA